MNTWLTRLVSSCNWRILAGGIRCMSSAFILCCFTLYAAEQTKPLAGAPADSELEFVVRQIEAMAQARMTISEDFVSASRRVEESRREKEAADKALKEVNAKLANLRETYRKTETSKTWPVRSDGVEFSENTFRGLIKISMDSKSDLEARSMKCAARVAHDSEQLGKMKLAIELLNVQEEKLKRDARDFISNRGMPGAKRTTDAIGSVMKNVGEIFDAAGVGDARQPDSTPDASSHTRATDDDVKKFLYPD